jgi:hypothetical protein
MMQKPKVFIGSSVEGLYLAYAIQENLQHGADPTVWSQGVFTLSKSALESLAEELGRSDFGIFVFTPDDRLLLRKKSYAAVRDNVIFELGLFAGRLGPRRIFIVVPAGAERLRIPTDLTGVAPGTYDPRRRGRYLKAALGPFCNQVREVMKRMRRKRQARAKVRARLPQLKGLSIYGAFYGAGRHRINVKDPVLTELHRYGSAYVGNQLAEDPCPGIPKDLILDFAYQGQRTQVTIPEGKFVEFPMPPSRRGPKSR